MEKMKILHILCTDRLSGAERVHLNILSALRDGCEVYYASPDGPIREAVEAEGVRFIPADTDDIREIKRLNREISPDVVHACDPRMSFKCARAKIPFIAHLHSNCPWMKKYSPNSFALRYALKRASAAIAVSKNITDEYIFASRFADKFTVLPNVVDSRAVTDGATEICEKRYDIVFVGRITEAKRPLLFASHIKELTKRLPNLSAAMVGEGELTDELLNYIKENGIENIDVLGFQSNPYKFMANSKLNMMTSRYEGFGLVAVEGMILGVPVIAYPSGGITAIASEGGVVCRTDGEMIEAAYRLLTNADEYEKLSAKAKEASAGYTDFSAYIERIKDIYRKAAAR